MNTFFKTTKKSIDKSQVENEKFYIEGVMSKPIVDFENEVIGSEAYNPAIQTIKERYAKGQPIPMFIEHRRKELSLPVGKVVDAWEQDNTLYFRGEIAGGSIGEPIRELIKGGYLYGCSIGGDALKTANYFDTKLNRDVRKITKMELRELSLTGLPVNSEAVFAIAKSLNKEEKEVKTLMKTLDKAIDSQKQIFDLEKAIDADNLDEQSLNRIKEALNNLAKLLKIDVSAEQSASTTTTEGEVAATTTSEVAPAKEETQEKQPTRKIVNANKQNDNTITEDEDIVEQETTNEESSMIKQDRLDEINSKLDQLLSHEQGEEKIEKDEDYAMVSDSDEDGEEDFEEEDDGNEKEDNNNNKNRFNRFKKNKKNKMKSLGGENMEILKCRGCETEFEAGIEKSYDPKFCPHCGDRLEKSMIENNDVVCEDCGSVFEKSEDYDLHYCPKCGKSMKDSIAVAPQPKGADTTYEASKEMPKGKEETDSIAVAPQPKGATTSVEAEEKKETGSSVNEFGDGNYIDATKKERTDKKDEDINESRPSGKPLLGSFDANKVSNYGKDKVGKSIDGEDRLTKIEKAIESLTTEKSVGRQSVIPEAIEKIKVEKSSTDQTDVDRAFARMILKK